MSENKGLEAHCWNDVGTYVTRAVKEMAGDAKPGAVELHITAKVGARTKHILTVEVGKIDNLKK